MLNKERPHNLQDGREVNRLICLPILSWECFYISVQLQPPVLLSSVQVYSAPRFCGCTLTQFLKCILSVSVQPFLLLHMGCWTCMLIVSQINITTY